MFKNKEQSISEYWYGLYSLKILSKPYQYTPTCSSPVGPRLAQAAVEICRRACRPHHPLQVSAESP